MARAKYTHLPDDPAHMKAREPGEADTGAEKTGEDAFARFHRATWRHHPDAKVCPRCGDDVNAVGITKLLYTFEVCSCRNGLADYDHLVEQLWHRTCFLMDRTVKC